MSFYRLSARQALPWMLRCPRTVARIVQWNNPHGRAPELVGDCRPGGGPAAPPPVLREPHAVVGTRAGGYVINACNQVDASLLRFPWGVRFHPVLTLPRLARARPVAGPLLNLVTPGSAGKLSPLAHGPGAAARLFPSRRTRRLPHRGSQRGWPAIRAGNAGRRANRSRPRDPRRRQRGVRGGRGQHAAAHRRTGMAAVEAGLSPVVVAGRRRSAGCRSVRRPERRTKTPPWWTSRRWRKPSANSASKARSAA